MKEACCGCGVEGHAYNGCADCTCNVSWGEHIDRDLDETPSGLAAREANVARAARRAKPTTLTFWQWWAKQRYSGGGETGYGVHDACPPLRTRSHNGDKLDSINWTEYSKPMVLHCWDVFACHWPQIFCAAVFGRP